MSMRNYFTIKGFLLGGLLVFLSSSAMAGDPGKLRCGVVIWTLPSTQQPVETQYTQGYSRPIERTFSSYQSELLIDEGRVADYGFKIRASAYRSLRQTDPDARLSRDYRILIELDETRGNFAQPLMFESGTNKAGIVVDLEHETLQVDCRVWNS